MVSVENFKNITLEAVEFGVLQCALEINEWKMSAYSNMGKIIYKLLSVFPVPRW